MRYWHIKIDSWLVIKLHGNQGQRESDYASHQFAGLSTNCNKMLAYKN